MMTLEQSLAVCQLSAIWRGLVRRLICRDLDASSDKATLDTACKRLGQMTGRQHRSNIEIRVMEQKRRLVEALLRPQHSPTLAFCFP
jgi:hypothetical protein